MAVVEPSVDVRLLDLLGGSKLFHGVGPEVLEEVVACARDQLVEAEGAVFARGRAGGFGSASSWRAVSS